MIELNSGGSIQKRKEWLIIPRSISQNWTSLPENMDTKTIAESVIN